jgi:hypothetical protein
MYMPRSTDVNFQNFIVRSISKTPLTTDQLYSLAQSRRLTLTRSRRRDANRPTQYAWQHQMRRDQFNLVEAGVIRRTANGTWTPTSTAAVKRFFANA